MANKTATDYENDYRTKETANAQNSYNTRKADTEQRKTARTASTQTYITGQNEIIDSATANSVQKVQQQIDAAPGEYQELFDRNALNEELGRQAAELKMANMGLTDSGLSSSSQAALSVQRMNADADARKSMREYVNELENYITDLTVAGENKKKQIGLDANYKDQLDFQSWDADLSNWYNNTLDNINTNAINYGAARFNADEANRATVEAANIAAAAEKEAANIAAAAEQAKADQEAKQAYYDTIVKLMDKGGMSYDEAAAVLAGETGGQTSGGTIDEDVRKALLAVTDWDTSGWKTFWSAYDGDDGYDVYTDVVKGQLQKSEGYKKLTSDQKMMATALTIGRAVATTWGGEGYKDEVRIKKALEEAGYTGTNLMMLYDAAIKAYEDERAKAGVS